MRLQNLVGGPSVGRDHALNYGDVGYVNGIIHIGRLDTNIDHNPLTDLGSFDE